MSNTNGPSLNMSPPARPSWPRCCAILPSINHLPRRREENEMPIAGEGVGCCRHRAAADDGVECHAVLPSLEFVAAMQRCCVRSRSLSVGRTVATDGEGGGFKLGHAEL